MTPLAWLAIPVLAALIASLVVGPVHRYRNRPLTGPERVERLRRALGGGSPR